MPRGAALLRGAAAAGLLVPACPALAQAGSGCEGVDADVRACNGADLADGQVGDTLGLTGDYRGKGGIFALDVGGAAADQIVIGGAATGSTLIAPSGLDGTLAADRVVVRAGPGSEAGAFTTGGLNVGFVEYGIRLNGDNSYSLVAEAGDAAYRAARYSEGVRQLWYQSSDAWSPHMRALRDGTVSEYTGRLWNQSYGTLHKRSGVQASQAGGIETEADVSAKQDHFGRQFGYDLVGGRGGSFVAGGTVGYIDSSLKLGRAAAGAEFDAFFGGLYAGWRGGPFFANILAKYDYYLIDARDRTAGFETDLTGSALGATAEVGLRSASRGLFVEPVASLSWVRSDIEDLEALGSRIEFDPDDGLRGKIGVRIGSVPDPEDSVPLSFYVGGNAVKEFGGEDEARLVSNGRSVSIAAEPAGLYGEATAGLTIFGRRISGFFEGTAIVGGREDLRGFAGRAGMRMALGGLFGGIFGR